MCRVRTGGTGEVEPNLAPNDLAQLIDGMVLRSPPTAAPITTLAGSPRHPGRRHLGATEVKARGCFGLDRAGRKVQVA